MFLPQAAASTAPRMHLAAQPCALSWRKHRQVVTGVARPIGGSIAGFASADDPM